MMNKKWLDGKKYIICFWGFLVLKLMLMLLFSSDYSREVFIPFVNVFLNGKNPYEYYYCNHLPGSFPYMPVMLFVESIGGAILKVFSIKNLILTNFVFKLPLLIFDYLGYYFLKKLSGGNKYILIIYMSSPIVLYSTYMHGQLDIIPSTLLVISVYYLVNWKKANNLILFSLYLGMAVGAKTHILAVIPILFFYIVRKRNYFVAVKALMRVLLITLLITIPFWGSGILYTVLLNKEQTVLFNVNINYGTVSVIVPILVLIIIYLKTYKLNYFNRELLVSMIAMTFAIFLICVPPNAGWFMWIVPFAALYFGYATSGNKKTFVIYMCFNISYLIYAVLLASTNYVDLYFLNMSLQNLKILNTELRCVVFTIVVATLGMTVYDIYSFGIASNSLYKRGNIPFVIGISGDSGTGKSYLMGAICNLFGNEKDVLFIEGDGDHKWERDDEKWDQFTALDPQSNYLYKQANDIRALKHGKSVMRVDYDHSIGKFTKEHKIKPRKFIVIGGLHSLFLPQMRRELDLKIYMDADEKLRTFWKLQRDSKNRGRQKEDILRQIAMRLSDAQKYIYPQKDYADIVITYYDTTLKNALEDAHTLELSVKITLDISFDVDRILSVFREEGLVPEHYITQDFDRQEILFESNNIKKVELDFANIASVIVPQYEDLFTYTPKWKKGVDGIVQMFLLMEISEKMKE